MKKRILQDSKGAEIREGCIVRTKALSADRQTYEQFKVERVHKQLCVRKKDARGNFRTYGIEYIQHWMKDDSMEVI